ncbi:MAG: HlyC/CorC family transporter [Chlorobiaceae bacterium]|nr:HlyC/CorC family transporter [Chlorobiaceae bacterium]
MNPDSTTALVILLLILANGVLSMAEFAVISSRPTRLHELMEAGYPSAALVLRLLENPVKFLSSIQVGAALLSTLAGALGGIAFSGRVAGLFSSIPLMQPYSNPIALGIVIIAITYVSLVMGELVPKKIALRHPESVALRIAAFIELLSRISAPAVNLINGSSSIVLRALGIDAAEKPLVSDEDVMLMIKQGAKKGVFESVEYEMISRIFRMSDKRASSIMTPRNEIEWLDLEKSDDELIACIKASGRSRFPVAEGNLDELSGVVRALDLVNLQLSKPGSVRSAIRESMKQPLFVPESIPAFQVLEVFKKNRAHLALVIDEHGSVQGAITLTDVLESIVGDVPADDLVVNRKIVRRSHRTWIVDGMLPVDEFISSFNLNKDSFLQDEEPRYETMGGFMMDKLGQVPSTSDLLRWQNILFKVIKMEGQRVARILVELNDHDSGKMTSNKPAG